jgi:hypothetical protein
LIGVWADEVGGGKEHGGFGGCIIKVFLLMLVQFAGIYEEIQKIHFGVSDE